jgi:hypothetical protein
MNGGSVLVGPHEVAQGTSISVTVSNNVDLYIAFEPGDRSGGFHSTLPGLGFSDTGNIAKWGTNVMNVYKKTVSEGTIQLPATTTAQTVMSVVARSSGALCDWNANSEVANGFATIVANLRTCKRLCASSANCAVGLYMGPPIAPAPPPTSVQSKKWRIKVMTSVGGGDETQVTELTLLDNAGTPLPGGPVVRSATGGGISNGVSASLLNNGNSQQSDVATCTPLPCTYTYHYGALETPAALRWAQHSDRTLLPKDIAVMYCTDDDNANACPADSDQDWQVLKAFTVTDADIPPCCGTQTFPPTASIEEGRYTTGNAVGGAFPTNWQYSSALVDTKIFDGDESTPISGDENGQHDEITAVKLTSVCQSSSIRVWGRDRDVPSTDLRHIRVAYSMDGNSWSCYTKGDCCGMTTSSNQCNYGSVHGNNGMKFDIDSPAQYIAVATWGRTNIFEIELVSCTGSSAPPSPPVFTDMRLPVGAPQLTVSLAGTSTNADSIVANLGVLVWKDQPTYTFQSLPAVMVGSIMPQGPQIIFQGTVIKVTVNAPCILFVAFESGGRSGGWADSLAAKGFSNTGLTASWGVDMEVWNKFIMAAGEQDLPSTTTAETVMSIMAKQALGLSMHLSGIDTNAMPVTIDGDAPVTVWKDRTYQYEPATVGNVPQILQGALVVQGPHEDIAQGTQVLVTLTEGAELFLAFEAGNRSGGFANTLPDDGWSPAGDGPKWSGNPMVMWKKDVPAGSLQLPATTTSQTVMSLMAKETDIPAVSVSGIAATLGTSNIGATVWTDQDYRFSSMPADTMGGVLVQIPFKVIPSGTIISLTTNVAVDMYVVHEIGGRDGGLPISLSALGWQEVGTGSTGWGTDGDWTSSNNQAWKKIVAAGTTTLPAVTTPETVMSIIVKPASGDPSREGECWLSSAKRASPIKCASACTSFEKLDNVQSTMWRAMVKTAQHASKVQLSEITFLDSSGTRLLGTPVVTGAGGSGIIGNSAALMNNGQQQGDDADCSLPCSYTYTYPDPVTPATLRWGRGSQGTSWCPANIDVEYWDGSEWKRFKELEVTANDIPALYSYENRDMVLAPGGATTPPAVSPTSEMTATVSGIAATTATAQVGALVWSDRNYVFGSLPALLVGSLFFKGPHEAVASGTVIKVQVTHNAHIFVAFESGSRSGGFADSLPGVQFAKTGETIQWNLETMEVWRKSVNAGEVVLPATTTSQTVVSIFLKKRETALEGGCLGTGPYMAGQYMLGGPNAGSVYLSDAQIPGCKKEGGQCMTAENAVQTEGREKLDSGDLYNQPDKQRDCFKRCRARSDATGCEVAWGGKTTATMGCFVHTSPIDHGGGQSGGACWPFQKCVDPSNTKFWGFSDVTLVTDGVPFTLQHVDLPGDSIGWQKAGSDPWSRTGVDRKVVATDDGPAHGLFRPDEIVEKIFTNLRPHSLLRLKVRFWAVDAWESGNVGIIRVDHKQWWSKSHSAMDSECTNGGTAFSGYFPNPFEESEQAHHKCFWDVDEVRHHDLSSAYIQFQSVSNVPNMDQVSYAFNRLEIHTDADGAPALHMRYVDNPAKSNQSGWSVPDITDTGDGYVHGMFDYATRQVEKTFTMPHHSMVRIRVRIWTVDSWDHHERVEMQVDGRIWWWRARRWNDGCDKPGAGVFEGEFPNPWASDGYYGGHALKCFHDVDVVQPHFGPMLKLLFYANLHQHMNDESWAFNHVRIYSDGASEPLWVEQTRATEIDGGWSDDRIQMYESTQSVHGLFEKNEEASRMFTVDSHSFLRVRARFWALETWDFEEFGFLKVDDQIWWQKPALADQRIINEETAIARGKTYATSFTVYSEYALQFDLWVSGIQPRWNNILHFTTEMNCCWIYERIPAIWLFPGSRRLHVRQAQWRNGNDGCDPADEIELDKWTNIRVEVRGYRMFVLFDNAVKCVTTAYRNKIASPRMQQQVHVYVSDPWHHATFGKVRNMRYGQWNSKGWT